MTKIFRILLIHPDREYLRTCQQALQHSDIDLIICPDEVDIAEQIHLHEPHVIFTEAMTTRMDAMELVNKVMEICFFYTFSGNGDMTIFQNDAQNLARIGTWTVNLETGETFWSDALFELSGMEPGECEPSIDMALRYIHPDYHQIYSDLLDQCIHALQPFSQEMIAVRKNGEELWINASGRAVVNEAGKPVRLDGIVQDISERKKNEIRLKEEMNFNTSLLENIPGILTVFDEQGIIHRWNQYALHATGYSEQDMIGKRGLGYFLDEGQDAIQDEILRVFHGESCEVFTTILTKDGVKIPYQFNVVRYDSQECPMAIAIGFDRTLQTRADQALLRQLTELMVLQDITRISLETNDEDDLISQATLLLSEKIYMDHFGMVIRNDKTGLYLIHSSYTGLRPDTIRLEFKSGIGIIGRCIAEKRQLRVDDVSLHPEYVQGSQTDMRSELCVPMIVDGDVIGIINAESKNLAAFSEEDERLLSTAATLLGVAIQKIRLFQMERQRHLEAEVQYEVSRALTMSLELNDVLDNLLIGLERVIPYDSSAIFFMEGQYLRIVWGRGFPIPGEIIGLISSIEDELFQVIKTTRQALIVDDVRADGRFLNYGDLDYVRSWMGVPLIDQGEVFGYFTMDKTEPGFFTAEKAALALTFANHASSAIMKARFFNQIQQRFSQLQALHEIDQMITTSFDLRLTMTSFLNQVCSQLNVDAADVLKFNPYTHELDFVMSHGFRTSALEHTHLALNKGYAGKAAMNRSIVHVANLNDEHNEFSRSHTFADEAFHTYFGVPLIAKGEVKGVLEVFHRAPLMVDDEWLEFLHILSTQAAIAIENMDLFENLQTTNLELTLAYDATLEGWARTLEMRDQETEGHSARVTELTIQLARAMGIEAEEMIHIRRGAMLHDIGKIGIPDSILQKPAALDTAEWEIMRTHPMLAYNALAQIPFLKPALDIPYYHHEKWDGSGYPQGLSGKAIPLSARIFAIIDVYDALSSRRPYRPPWQQDRIIQYIREQSGKHFDPDVVDAFLDLLEQNPRFGSF